MVMQVMKVMIKCAVGEVGGGDGYQKNRWENSAQKKWVLLCWLASGPNPWAFWAGEAARLYRWWPEFIPASQL